MKNSMRWTQTGLLFGAAITTVAANCNHNNCLRAVIGSSFPTRHGVEDCGSYLAVTETPATTSFTSIVAQTTITLDTTTVTETVEPNGLKARTFSTITSLTSLSTAGTSSSGGTTFPAYASACSKYSAYQSACSCVGVTAETTTLPTPSTTVTITSGTQTVIPTATATVTNIVVNGGFETGDWAPWVPTTGKANTRAYGSIEEGGDDSTWRVLSDDLYDNRLFEFYQDIHGVRGTQYQCSYNWKFTNYYVTEYQDGNDYVPYIHGYLNNNLWTTDVPDPDDLDDWQTTTFQFTSKGKDRWWFDCASPQPQSGDGGGENYLSIDNVACIAMS